MNRIHWLEPHPSRAGATLRAALETWGHEVVPGPGVGSLVLVAERPDPQLIPAEGSEILWWVEHAEADEVSAVLGLRPGWVLLQDRPLEAARDALQHLRQRDLGSEGWLRQMLHLASLDDLLKVMLSRAISQSRARGGAIWLRKENLYYQRAGDGSFPEAPLPRQEAAELVRRGEAFALAASEQLGLLRLLDPHEPPERLLQGFEDVEPLLLNAWRLEESRALSFKDDLTVAQNRRCLEAELPQAVRAAAARGESVALVFLDVDDLRQVNSQYGHPAGSIVLEAVARTAQRLCRAHDRLYRYGGDEFCILMPGTLARGAQKLAERLVQVILEQPITLGNRAPGHLPQRRGRRLPRACRWGRPPDRTGRPCPVARQAGR